MADDSTPETPDDPTPDARAVRLGRYATEAELADAADAARRRAGLTQKQLADRLGVQQPSISAALDYANPKNATKGHALRRRILADLSGLEIAGPYWLPVRPGTVPPGSDPHRDAAADVPAP